MVLSVDGLGVSRLDVCKRLSLPALLDLVGRVQLPGMEVGTTCGMAYYWSVFVDMHLAHHSFLQG